MTALLLALAFAPVTRDAAPTADVELTGRLSDYARAENHPTVLRSQNDLDALAERWGITDVPRVDFGTVVLVVGTTFSPRPEMTLILTDGDLTVRMARPGRLSQVRVVGYVIRSYPRTQVASVNGVPLLSACR